MSHPLFAEKTEVAIIGAGLAGLTATYRLQGQGIDFQLYEAKNRVGGRVFTVQNGDNAVELGGHSITDGGEAKNLLSLIEHFGLELETQRIQMQFTYVDGKQLFSFEELLKQRHFDPEQLRAELERFAQTAPSLQEVIDQLFDPEDPLLKALIIRLTAYEGNTPDQLSPIYIETLFDILPSLKEGDSYGGQLNTN